MNVNVEIIGRREIMYIKKVINATLKHFFLIMSNSAIELVNGIFIVKTHFEYSILNYLYQWTWIKCRMFS